MRLARVVNGLAAALLSAATLPAAPFLDCGVVPGWTQEGPGRAYEPDTLFDYMDGNAEGYIVYRFVHMDGITCRSGDERLVIDASEMADPEHAFGLFSATRDSRLPVEPIGMGGQVTARRAVFAKDRYYVEIAAQSDQGNRRALTALARAIEAKIPGRAAAPDALAWFPAQGRVADSVRLVPESVLGVRALASGYVGLYDFGEAFVVTQPSSEVAEQLMIQLKARWAPVTPESIADEAFRARDPYLGDLLVFRKGPRVAGYAKLTAGFDAATPARRLAAQLP
jgi:hypothetical protein